MSDVMNALPPLDVRDDKLLPTVVRRNGHQAPAVVGNRASRGRMAVQSAALNDRVSNGEYASLLNHGSPAPKSGLYPKGMIIDVWA
jgi:hypothetical protein